LRGPNQEEVVSVIQGARKDFTVFYEKSSGHLTGVEIGVSTGVSAHGAAVWIPRYLTSNPSDGVAWDKLDLFRTGRRGRAFTRHQSIGERYFDMKAINDIGVFFGVTWNGNDFSWLQELGANTRPRWVGLS
jgi:hypothetical protein